jgi:predicted PhzF superfamily epimerase YddE/YHI9
LLNALGVSPLYVGRNAWDYLIEVESEEFVRGMQPDFSLLKQVPARGVIVTSASGGMA